MTEEPVNPPRRPYRSTKRAQAAMRTRAAILLAAEALFLRDGYVGTSMKRIAARAGVSEKTMYLAFDTKATLLRRVIQAAVRGDEDAAPLTDQPQWRGVVAGPPAEALARFAAQNAALMTRTAPIVALGEAAAAADPELAAHRDDAHAAARADLCALAAALKHRGSLRADVDEQDAADIMYALAADESVFLRLTRECGWDEARYADLIARALAATLGP
jgi:AcrR family transcriptional regulator